MGFGDEKEVKRVESNQAGTTAGTTAGSTSGTTAGSTAGSTSGTAFGTTSGTSTSGGPQWLTDAGQSNLDFAKSLQTQGFTPYSGQQVAGFSPQQMQSFGLATGLSDGISPYAGQSGALLSSYANAGPQNVSADTIASRMSPYMSQYVQQALTPQLQMQDQQFATQNKGVDSAATMAGAFGDTGWGQLRGSTTQAQNAARAGLIGNAYNSAFNTAIGAGAQDVSNNLNAQNTNASLAETALGRQLAGGNALYNQGTGAANLTNQFGGQQTAQQQAQLNALFNQWQMAQQYPFQTTQLMNQTLGATGGIAPKTNTTSGTTTGITSGNTSGNTSGTTSGTTAGTTTGNTTGSGTQTTYAPDNSGFGMLGSALGLVAAPFTGGASLLPGLVSGASGLFGGSSSPSVTSAGQPQSAMWSADGTRPLFAADGGAVPAGKPVVVGERGPEVIVPGADSVVIPNEVMRAAQDKRKAAVKKKPASPTKFGLAA